MWLVGGGKPRQSARIEDPVEAGRHKLVVLPTCPVRGLSPGVLEQVWRQQTAGSQIICELANWYEDRGLESGRQLKKYPNVMAKLYLAFHTFLYFTFPAEHSKVCDRYLLSAYPASMPLLPEIAPGFHLRILSTCPRSIWSGEGSRMWRSGPGGPSWPVLLATGTGSGLAQGPKLAR